MKDLKLVGFFLLAVMVAASGCAKKSSEQSSISGAGFDSSVAIPANTNEELSQLPQAGAVNQLSSVEALPVEASPVSQAATTALSANADVAVLGSPKSLTHEQQIQTALKNLGLYNGKIDGKLGPGSKRAIEAFQKQNGLVADGKVGTKTWTALSTHLNPEAAVAVATGDPSSGNQ